MSDGHIGQYRADELNIPVSMCDGIDIHLHVPAGAIPKDGASAGVVEGDCNCSG